MFSLQHFLKSLNYLNTIKKYIANQIHEKKNQTQLKGSGLTSRFENLLRKLQ